MGIFDAQAGELFVTWRATIRFRDKVMGGTPGDPSLVEDWIRAQTGAAKNDQILRRLVVENLRDLKPDEDAMEALERSLDEDDGEAYLKAMDAAIASVAQQKSTNVFKRNETIGLYLEDRKVKAMIKEVVNVLWAGERWGKTRKGPKNYVAERIFIRPSRIAFGRQEPDGVELFVGHVSDRQGPRSTLTYYEYCSNAELTFYVQATKDAAEAMEGQWPSLWLHAQENGLGALRSQSHGRFEVLEWEEVEALPPEVLDEPTVLERERLRAVVEEVA